ncbi:hypothetical protein DPMN_175721 [Dreissena polymorpha]|uniref:Uncharacterized protein n=1 Tax=Dreissena polymorpha TaxID=45954 RepID=A0A9D4E8T1_DREPO|nr:hypothetical protein DPMN_175721 [Dreissena polymorpha]
MTFHCVDRARKSNAKVLRETTYTICTGRHREQPERHRSSTGNIQTLAELRQRPGGALVNAGRVPVKLRYISKPALCRDATGIHRGSAGALPATTGALP